MPAESDVAQVTAIAASAMLAEFHAKVALLLGSVEGCAYLERQPGVEGVLVTMEHDLVTTTGISELAFRSSREPVAV